MFGLDNQSEFGGVEKVTVKRGVPSERRSQEYWKRWQRPDDWPVRLNIVEAAAYLRVSLDTIRRAVRTGRDGRARLAHHRLGTRIVIRRADLDVYGYVQARA
jgi:excisionase family DNA binding protein